MEFSGFIFLIEMFSIVKHAIKVGIHYRLCILVISGKVLLNGIKRGLRLLD
jgi:hypothetical protein